MAKGKAATGPGEKLREIYFAIGLAMTQWQQVELALTQLFVLLVNPREGIPATAAFASILNFNSKLGMVDSAAYVVLRNTPLFAEWSSLFNALGRKAKKRNQIAHFMLYQESPVLQGGAETPAVETLNRQVNWYLQPTFFDGAVQHRYGGDPPKLTTSDIMNRANAFIEAAERVWEFSGKVAELRGLPLGSPSPKDQATPG